jgi:hypothetical protein
MKLCWREVSSTATKCGGLRIAQQNELYAYSVMACYLLRVKLDLLRLENGRMVQRKLDFLQDFCRNQGFCCTNLSEELRRLFEVYPGSQFSICNVNKAETLDDVIYDGFWLDHQQSGAPTLPESRQDDPKKSVLKTQRGPFSNSVENLELLAKGEDSRH